MSEPGLTESLATPATPAPPELPELPEPPAQQEESLTANIDTAEAIAKVKFGQFHFNDQARLQVTFIVLGIFGGFLLLSLFGWLSIAALQVFSGTKFELTKQFTEFAQFVITPLVGIVSGASGFYEVDPEFETAV